MRRARRVERRARRGEHGAESPARTARRGERGIERCGECGIEREARGVRREEIPFENRRGEPGADGAESTAQRAKRICMYVYRVIKPICTKVMNLLDGNFIVFSWVYRGFETHVVLL